MRLREVGSGLQVVKLEYELKGTSGRGQEGLARLQTRRWLATDTSGVRSNPKVLPSCWTPTSLGRPSLLDVCNHRADRSGTAQTQTLRVLLPVLGRSGISAHLTGGRSNVSNSPTRTVDGH